MIECNSIEEVRENINQIDEEIVKLIAKRGLIKKIGSEKLSKLRYYR
ncbi:MAG: hypothetical protein PHE16_02650 [Aliarcobacter sp.]|nr:hypothetical protein [Aliarcobacter sp.]